MSEPAPITDIAEFSGFLALFYELTRIFKNTQHLGEKIDGCY